MKDHKLKSKIKTTIKAKDQEQQQDFQTNNNNNVQEQVPHASSSNSNAVVNVKEEDNVVADDDELEKGKIKEGDGVKNKALKKVAVCGDCGLEFNSPQALGGHMRTHSKNTLKTTLPSGPKPSQHRKKATRVVEVEGGCRLSSIASSPSCSSFQNHHQGYSSSRDQHMVGSGSGSGSVVSSLLSGEPQLRWKVTRKRNSRRRRIARLLDLNEIPEED